MEIIIRKRFMVPRDYSQATMNRDMNTFIPKDHIRVFCNMVT
ncbi:hypothetical protein CP10881SC42_0048 [Chlamydia avium]|uniref:Uncharacterized protein n=1 Tax=Chlamydia avium TaxID=1457141 RepID=A0ABN0MTX3_9CHLA|nr:hypothetical protein CP10743SC13_0951 [Chlamydia psittaci 10_743_SC13]EPP38903.1 hypothetical protein CP10881SC42_0048 [Chlamydia avium]